MPKLNYSFMDALNSYINMASDFKSFPIFAIGCLIVVLLIGLNLKTKNSNFLFYILNFLLLGIIIVSNGFNIVDNIETFTQTNIFKNMYFYLFNMLVALIVMFKIYASKRVSIGFKYYILVLYYFLIVNLFFMIHVSNYFNNIELMVIGNVYPMVLFGNIVCFILYGSIILNWLTLMPKKRKHRLGNNL